MEKRSSNISAVTAVYVTRLPTRQMQYCSHRSIISLVFQFSGFEYSFNKSIDTVSVSRRFIVRSRSKEEVRVRLSSSSITLVSVPGVIPALPLR